MVLEQRIWTNQKNNFQNLSSYRIFELVKKIPNEDEKLDNFVKYYDQISHGAFENSYLDLFTNDNRFKLLENLHHPHVVTYFNSFKEKDSIYIILEYMNLLDYKNMQRVIQQILEQLIYL